MPCLAKYGSETPGLAKGVLVVASWSVQDNTCEFCRAGLTTACAHMEMLSAAQAELIRIPQAAGSLKVLPATSDPVQLLSLLTLADVYGTGHHAAKRAGVRPATPSRWSGTVRSACSPFCRRGNSVPSGSS